MHRAFAALLLFAGSFTAQAQTPTSATAPPPGSAVVTQIPEEPSLAERRLVAYVATGVALASLATGITFGVLAQVEFDCAKDVIACNDGLENKIVGEELFDVRAEIEQKALIADMAYLFAAASAVVATVGYIRGFAPTEEEAAAAPMASIVPVSTPAPALVAEVSP